MRRDKNAPALLEVISLRKPDVPLRPSPPSHRAPKPLPVVPDTAPPEPPRLVSPGTSIRVPIGFLVPIALLLAAMLVGAYAIGYQARRAEERRHAAAVAAVEMGSIIDPLASPTRDRPSTADNQRPSTPQTQSPPPQGRAALPSQGARVARDAVSSSPVEPTRPAARRAESFVIVNRPEEDPRQTGLNYLIAATLPPDEAEKAARFLASKGLEIAVVPVENRPSLRWVVVLKGVAAKDLSAPATRQLEQRLQDFGREYRQVHKGPTVFNDPWWKKHTK